jgi:hypothetical protein
LSRAPGRTSLIAASSAARVAVRTRFFTRLSGGTVKLAPVSAKYPPTRAHIDIDHVAGRQAPRPGLCFSNRVPST